MNPRELLIHERRIEAALAKASRRRGDEVEGWTPVDELMLRDDLREYEKEVLRVAEETPDVERNDDAKFQLFAEWMRLWFDFVFEDGPHPGWALRRVYALARRYRPHVIMHMNGTDLALIFGESRAAQSWRMQQLFDRLKACGVAGNRGSGFKMESTRVGYAKAAKGNHNRRGGAGKTKKKS